MVLGISLAYVIRLTRQSVSENVSADYVRTARAWGLTNRAVMSRHILRNSVTVATFLGGDLGAATSWVAPSSPRGIFSVERRSAARSGRPSDWAGNPTVDVHHDR